MNAPMPAGTFLELTRSEQCARGCQLCHAEPAIGKISVPTGTFRLGQKCGDKIKEIAADAGVEFVFP